MAEEIYLAGDFSGIQRFVLRVKTAGKAQAKRLRARSFLLQLLEHATLSILRTRFALEEEDVLVQGGMRAELEKHLDRFGGRDRDRPCGCARDECPICRVFGAHMNARSTLGPSRIIVRDGRLRGDWRIENKTENVIDRRTGAAQH